jgi:hypothetical protein
MSLTENTITGLKILTLNFIGLLLVATISSLFNYNTTQPQNLTIMATLYILTVITLQGLIATKIYNWK